MTNNSVFKCVITALSMCTSKNSVFPDFLIIQLNRKSGLFALKHNPHIKEKFKTLTFKIGGLWAEIFVRNHKSIPIYN